MENGHSLLILLFTCKQKGLKLARTEKDCFIGLAEHDLADKSDRQHLVMFKASGSHRFFADVVLNIALLFKVVYLCVVTYF